jgi:uncharacterized membrane protein YfcA
MGFYVILIGVALVIGLSKGGMGAVLGVLATPLLSLVMPVPTAISLSLPMLLIGDAFALWFYWKTWDTHYIRLLVPSAILGIIVGTALLASLDNITLRHVLGIFTLVFVVYKIADRWLRSLDYHPRNWHGYIAGAAAGLGSTLANTGGPPFTAYMLLQNVSPTVFVGTTTLFFAIVNLIKLPGLILAGLMNLNDLISVAWVIVLIPVGVYAGRWMVQRVNKAAFDWIMLVVLVIAAAVLLFL